MSPSDRLRRAKYRVMGFLPGKRGRRYREKLDRELRFEAAVAAAAGMVCIDLGANIGLVTRALAATASRVLAFEPDPWSAARLRENVADLANVEVVEAAAGIADGTATIYRAKEFDSDPAFKSLSSSMIRSKINVDPDAGTEVQVIDFAAYLERLDQDIGVLKIDIEGAEVELLEHLLDHPVLPRIRHVFVETHETKIPALAQRTRALVDRVRHLDRPVFHMDWQ